jgi:hypothetical protein
MIGEPWHRGWFVDRICERCESSVAGGWFRQRVQYAVIFSKVRYKRLTVSFVQQLHAFLVSKHGNIVKRPPNNLEHSRKTEINSIYQI